MQFLKRLKGKLSYAEIGEELAEVGHAHRYIDKDEGISRARVFNLIKGGEPVKLNLALLLCIYRYSGLSADEFLKEVEKSVRRAKRS
jgi:hypothetical protein